MATDKNLQAWLKKNQEAFEGQAQAAAQGGDFWKPDPGTYVGRVSSCEIGPSKNSGKMQVTWQVTIIDDSEANGKTHFFWDQLETERGFEFLCYRLKSMEIDLDYNKFQLTKLPAVLEQIAEEKPVVRFTVKNNGDFQNTKIVKVLHDYDAD